MLLSWMIWVIKFSGTYTHDTRVQIGIGDYYMAMGDSITRGTGDDDPSLIILHKTGETQGVVTRRY